MRKYAHHIKAHWYCFLLGPFFMILEACGEFVLPYINANIINKGAASGDIAYILQNGLYMALLALAMMITGVLGANFAIRGASYLSAGIRSDVFRQIQKFSFANIDAFTTGSLITRITNDVTQIQNFVQMLLRGAFRTPVMLVGALVMSFIMSPRLAWVILLIIPLLALATLLIVTKASPRYTTMQRALDGLNNAVNETITNEKVIKSFVREDHEIEKFSRINNALMEKSTAALKIMLFMQPVSTLAVNITTLAVVWFAGRPIMIGDMEIGTLTAFITYLSQVLTALNFLANIILRYTRAAASDKRIAEVLNATLDLTDETATFKDHPIEQGGIEFKNVSFRYFKHNHEKVLDDISLTIHPGELVGIIGSTGSGKTTLVSLIPRLYDADSGEILIDGINVRDYSLENLREGIAVVLQKNTLFTGTISDNLRWGNENASDEQLVQAAQIAQADGFIRSFPKGYDSDLESGGSNLSGGQRQRLCIARALLKKPKILILDDSTSAVDMATEASIRRGFRDYLAGTTKIIIAQRITSVADADKIIVLDNGRIVGMGTHDQLLANCIPYQEIFYSQKDREEAENHG